ncbi:hypothetical protein LCGC14_0821270 [marine sediment metagenome]|uniref:Uncharacterized protein n=1 Tax=marine sediment metagenome TaxID=412755 RepID=A0A0F9PND9_9ZZZZ
MAAKFTDGFLLERMTLANGSDIHLGEGAMCQGCAKEMSIVMQPSHGGMAPWVRVIWSEEGLPDWYFNMATLQRVVPKTGG